jgi:hypothetical protein
VTYTILLRPYNFTLIFTFVQKGIPCILLRSVGFFIVFIKLSIYNNKFQHALVNLHTINIISDHDASVIEIIVRGSPLIHTYAMCYSDGCTHMTIERTEQQKVNE